MKRWVWVVLAVVGVAVGFGIGHATGSTTVQRVVAPSESRTSTPATAAPFTAPSTTPPSPYPREIPVASISDSRIRDYFTEKGQASAVELDAGVYAEKGAGPVGNASLYTSILGLCVDVNRYEQTHPGRSHSCW